jgi:tetraprenyl-beta-curcumene synthase
MPSQLVSAGVFAQAARRYWLSVFPQYRHELRHWQARAYAIENPALRHLALEAQHAKQRSLEGAVAFAAFVPRYTQRHVITALTAYQVIFDYLDTLTEQPNLDPISNGRQLNQALLHAIEHQAPTECYALHEHDDDSGYLNTLIDTCKAALTRLPRYGPILAPLRRATERIVIYQSLNHGDANGSHDAFAQWARKETQPDTGLRWWETGAAAGSSLASLALISAMADTGLSRQDAHALEGAYHPWIGALHTLLDSLIDHHEDTVNHSQRSLIDYYSSPTETATRLEMIATQAVEHAKRLPHHHNHEVILAAMAGFYLSDPQAATPAARFAKKRVLATMGKLSGPTMLVMYARRSAGSLLSEHKRSGTRPRPEHTALTVHTRSR